jgi:DNA-binding PadR family transcriptional regulator
MCYSFGMRERHVQPDPQSLLPLPPAFFHILIALAAGEMHGYGIMQDVMERTEGKLRLSPGTLYGSLKRMLGEGLIEESDERPDPALDDERRRYYRLTKYGRAVASAESARVAALLSQARARKLSPKGT